MTGPFQTSKINLKRRLRKCMPVGHCADTCVHICAHTGPFSTSTSTRAPRPHTSLVPTSCEAGKALESIHSLPGVRLQQTAKLPGAWQRFREAGLPCRAKGCWGPCLIPPPSYGHRRGLSTPVNACSEFTRSSPVCKWEWAVCLPVPARSTCPHF